MTSGVPTSRKRCVYASGLLSGSFETVLQGDEAAKAAKLAAQRLLIEAGCPVEDGDGQPPLKCRRTGDLFVVQSTVPRNKHSLVIRRLLEPKAERPASTESSGRGVGAGSGGTKTASIVDLQKRLKALKEELAVESERAQAFEERLAETQAQVAETQARVARAGAQIAAFGAGVEGVLAQLASNGEQIQDACAQAEGIWAQVQGIQAQVQGTQAEVAAFQVQIAAVRQVAQKALTDAAQQRPFAEHAARCQVQALLECYQVLYFKEANNFRKGQPQNFTEAKQSWNDFVSCASPEEEAHMVSKGFTKVATDAARTKLGSFHDDFSASINELDLDLIRDFFLLLDPASNPGWEQALAVVEAHNASLIPPGKQFQMGLPAVAEILGPRMVVRNLDQRTCEDPNMDASGNGRSLATVETPGLSHKPGKAGVLRRALADKENLDANGAPRQAVGALLSAVQASLVDLKHEVAAAKNLSNTASVVLQSKNKPDTQAALSSSDGVEGPQQQLCTWLMLGVALAEAVHSRRSASQDDITSMPNALVENEKMQECISAAEDGSGRDSQRMPGNLENRIAALEVQLAQVLSRQPDPWPPSLSARHLVDALDCEAVRAEDLNSILGRLALTEEKLDRTVVKSAEAVQQMTALQAFVNDFENFSGLRDDLAMCKEGLQASAIETQGLLQGMQALQQQIGHMNSRMNDSRNAMNRLAAQQAANNHSMAAVASQHAQLQSTVDALERLQAQPGDSALLGRVEDLEAHHTAVMATMTALEAAQSKSLAERLVQLEKEIVSVKQQSATACELAQMVELQQGSMQQELDAKLTNMGTIAKEQDGQLSSLTAAQNAHATDAAESSTRLESLKVTIVKLEDKVASLATELHAVAEKAALAASAPSADMLDRQSALQTAQERFEAGLSAVKAQMEQLQQTLVSEASKFGAAVDDISSAHSSTAASVGSMQVEIKCACEELQQLSAAVKEAKTAAADAQRHTRDCMGDVQMQMAAWTASTEVLAADHELAAAETGEALKAVARINADHRAMQQAQLELAADCSSHKAAITQLQATLASDSTATNVATLTARMDALDKHELVLAESRKGINCISKRVALLEDTAAQTGRELSAAKQQADTRIRRTVAEMHELQETVLELGTAMQASEASEAAWGDSLASVQTDVEAMQQNIERSTQERGRVTAALQADMARIAGCLNQARSVLSDHAQQLGRLSQLPVELSGVAEEVTSVQRDVARVNGRLELVAVLPAKLDSVAEQVTALGSKQEDTLAAVEEGMTSTGQQIERIQAELTALQAQASTLGQQCEKHADMASRLAATEVHLDGIEQVHRAVSAVEGRIRAVECTVADALEEEAAQMVALQEAVAEQATKIQALQAAGTPQKSPKSAGSPLQESQDTASSAAALQVAADAASSRVPAQSASRLLAAERGRQQRQRLQIIAQRSRASRQSVSQADSAGSSSGSQ
ncbi:hypothetical protein COCOBI_08-3330 [Coccomyxa sp. Obi]|nr:hypothetical protein COCOBI_08-3330 [Coccomyxa sp. Obi]